MAVIPPNFSEELGPIILIVGLLLLVALGLDGNITGMLGAAVGFYFTNKVR